MTGYHCSARRQSPRLLPLLVLATFMTFFVTYAEALNCAVAPEIITYGDCSHRLHQLPYQIQTPLIPNPPQPPPSSCRCPSERKSYGYNIDGPTDPYHPSNVGFQLPVSIQQPLVPAQPPPYSDPLRGKSYGVGIESAPSSPHYSPSLGQYNFGIQKPVPGAKPAPVDTSDPYRVEVQPGAIPNQGSPLWAPMPIGIERPQIPSGPGPAGPAPRLTGLTSTVDKLLLPIYCPMPMDGQGGGSPGGGYPGGSCPIEGGGYPGGSGPMGGGGYPGGSGPMGGGGYPGGSGALGGGGYSSCSCL